MGLRLSQAKTMITHIDEGLDFLGWRIQRHRKRGTTKQFVYTYPAKKALKAITVKVKTICRTDINRPLPALLRRLNPVLRGWCNYFRTGVSSSTFQYLSKIAWRQVMKWLWRKHRRPTWKWLRRRYCGGGWWPTASTGRLFDPGAVHITRYRYRGTAIPTPWTVTA
ncbi:group II intron maturase-specific domain-containing protein [Nocardia sp. NPDC052278]|uniref:group II intron maturase-specific domain-containing protein n=1 Tax=unclassified Nocardia TaxID=2637762 RepID=UPI003683F520